MEFFFEPRGVAVVGATANKNKDGYSIIKNLIMGYRWKIYSVNPKYREIEGKKCYSSISEVSDPVDLAIIFIPAPAVPALVAECARRRIPGVMIQSAGFAEVGEEGRALQDKLVKIARETGIRIWGPNCMGLVDAVRGNVFSFVSPVIWEEGLLRGKVSLIVQSGLLSAGFLIDMMSHGRMGISKACSIGNKADVDECDLLEYLINDSETRSIGLYVESIAKGHRFLELCKASQKPIVVLKGGKTERGARAAMSHTASMAGDSLVVAGALKQVGVIQANDFHQMADIAKALAMYPKVRTEGKGRVAILTFSGAAGIVSTDLMADKGLEIADLSEHTLSALKKVFPDWMPPSNPIDLWPAVERSGPKRAYGEAVKAVCADPGVDAIVIHLFIGGIMSRELDINSLVDSAKGARKPLFIWAIGTQKELRDFRIRTQDMGVPVYGEIERGIDALAAVFQGR